MLWGIFIIPRKEKLEVMGDTYIIDTSDMPNSVLVENKFAACCIAFNLQKFDVRYTDQPHERGVVFRSTGNREDFQAAIDLSLEQLA